MHSAMITTTGRITAMTMPHSDDNPGIISSSDTRYTNRSPMSSNYRIFLISESTMWALGGISIFMTVRIVSNWMALNMGQTFSSDPDQYSCITKHPTIIVYDMPLIPIVMPRDLAASSGLLNCLGTLMLISKVPEIAS